MCYPMSITATGMVVCHITSLFATHCMCGRIAPPVEQSDQPPTGEEKSTPEVEEKAPTLGEGVEYQLKKQLVISTLLMTPIIFFISALMLPSTFWVETRIGQYNTAPKSGTANLATCEEFVYPPLTRTPSAFPVAMSHSKFSGKTCVGAIEGDGQEVQWWQVAITVTTGLWAGLVIGFITEYYTSNQYQPVQEVAESCQTGAATNIIYGLALGYKSAVIPCLALAIAIYTGYGLAKMFGVA